MEVHVIDVPIERHVVERFAQAMGVPPDELDLAEPLEGEDWEEELIEEICRHLGLAPEVIFPSVERSQRSEIALAGLRRLAPFCGRAARRLQEMQVR